MARFPLFSTVLDGENKKSRQKRTRFCLDGILRGKGVCRDFSKNLVLVSSAFKLSEVALGGDVGREAVEGGGGMAEELAIALAEVVVAGMSVAVLGKSVAWTFAVACKAPPALAALLGETVDFLAGKLLVAWRMDDGRERRLAQIAEAVFGESEVVAGVDGAVGFDNGPVAAGTAQGAESWRHVEPVGQG